MVWYDVIHGHTLKEDFLSKNAFYRWLNVLGEVPLRKLFRYLGTYDMTFDRYLYKASIGLSSKFIERSFIETHRLCICVNMMVYDIKGGNK